jgi:GNAT superfamily N-acetyltransferase
LAERRAGTVRVVAELSIRPYEDADEDRVLALLAVSLGKTVDTRYRSFFRWKHVENPFGRSCMWVAEVDGELAGFRAFLRWRFIDPGGDPIEAVRAVDTATDPGFRGMGIFRELTMHGLEEMRPAGIQFVFNTPNDQSRPGYLKMGWVVESRVPVQVRPRSPVALWRMARARTAADAWSLPIEVGLPVDGTDALAAAVEPHPAPSALTTDRTVPFLRWRYGGFPDVASRVLPAAGGAALVRFRRRGSAVEATVGDVVGTTDRRAVGSAVRAAVRTARADYAIAATASPVGGMVPARRLGPIQTRRDVAEQPTRLPLALTLGDVELF